MPEITNGAFSLDQKIRSRCRFRGNREFRETKVDNTIQEYTRTSVVPVRSEALEIVKVADTDVGGFLVPIPRSARETHVAAVDHCRRTVTKRIDSFIASFVVETGEARRRVAGAVVDGCFAETMEVAQAESFGAVVCQFGVVFCRLVGRPTIKCSSMSPPDGQQTTWNVLGDER
jgi:hypothetical protein